MSTNGTAERLTYEQAAVMLGCSVRTVERLKKSGALGHHIVGVGAVPRVYFTEADVQKYLRTTARPAKSA